MRRGILVGTAAALVALLTVVLAHAQAMMIFRFVHTNSDKAAQEIAQTIRTMGDMKEVNADFAGSLAVSASESCC